MSRGSVGPDGRHFLRAEYRFASHLAVMVADGGEAITDMAVLRDQSEVFGPVASTPTAWRLLADIDETGLARLRAARAQA